jgi:hypothetical protein
MVTGVNALRMIEGQSTVGRHPWHDGKMIGMDGVSRYSPNWACLGLSIGCHELRQDAVNLFDSTVQ